jgi:hypothetical protein
MRAGPHTTAQRDTGSDKGVHAALKRADRLYARLLWLLPAGLRREYGPAMRQTFADLCAARVATRGRGLAPVVAYGVADLIGGATREWATTLFARDRWHHRTATGLCALAGLLVLYSQVRYPANLLRIDYLAEYLLLLVVLAALAHGFATGAGVSPRTVLCALATVPGWLISLRYPLAGLGYVAALIALAAIGEARRSGPAYAGLRAGVTGGVLAGVTVLAVSVTTGVVGMDRLIHDPAYHAEFLRTGQPDPAAYIIGARICGAAMLLLACAVGGALFGLVASAGRAVALRGARPS